MFSSELRERRRNAGLSLREASLRMEERGVKLSFSMLCRYEHGRGLEGMNLKHARAISRLYRWSMVDITRKIAEEVSAKEVA